MVRKHVKRMSKTLPVLGNIETASIAHHQTELTTPSFDNMDDDDDGASNSTADSIAEDDTTVTQDIEERGCGGSGIKLVLKKNNTEFGSTSGIYSPSHTYSPMSTEEKRRKHKKKKKKKSSERHRHSVPSLNNESLDSVKKYHIASSTAANDPNDSDNDTPPAKKQRLVLEEGKPTSDALHDYSISEQENKTASECYSTQSKIETACLVPEQKEKSVAILSKTCKQFEIPCEEDSRTKKEQRQNKLKSVEETRIYQQVSYGVDSQNERPNTQDNSLKTEQLTGTNAVIRNPPISPTSQQNDSKVTTDRSVIDAEVEAEEVSQNAKTEDFKRRATRIRPLLSHLHKQLAKTDVHGIFAYPVNDLIAPGYSSIITQPMDFCTIATNIKTLQYYRVADLKRDFELMCNNAMTYNQAETIYYKEAARLLQYGGKMLSKDKLSKIVRSNNFFASITSDDFGFETSAPVALPPIMPEKLVEEIEPVDTPDSFPESLSQSVNEPLIASGSESSVTTDNILAQAQSAARAAAHKLTLRKPQSRFGFLRQRPDGSTSFNIVNPDNSGIVSDTERHVDIGSLLTKLPSGGTTISGFKEDRRNKVNTINYLNYGPFSSFAPQYDSSFANVSKDDSDLLLSTYKDPIGVNYAKSVLDFVENAGDYAVRMVNELLDMLSNNEHTKTQKILNDKKKNTESNTSVIQETTPEFCSLKPLSEECAGENDHALLANTSTDPLQKQLDITADLLRKLEKSQHDRLSQPPPSDLNHVAAPTSTELQLANEVCNNLKDITKQLAPGDVVSERAIHKVLGISGPPMTSSASTSQLLPLSMKNVNTNSMQKSSDVFNETNRSLSNQVESRLVIPSVTTAETTERGDYNLQLELERILDESSGMASECPPLVMTDRTSVENVY